MFPKSSAPPCTCIKGTMKRPPVLDPFCPRDAAHRAVAVLEYEPEYPKRGNPPK